MSDLIIREALCREIRGWQEDIHDNEYDANRYDFVFNRIYEMLDEAFVVDVVEVVRCGDCVNFEARAKSDGEYGYCWHWDFEQGMSPNEVFANDFCSYGERKENT